MVDKCSKCGGEIEPGWLDRAVWRKGELKRAPKIALGLTTIAYRCKNCGFLEFYVIK